MNNYDWLGSSMDSSDLYLHTLDVIWDSLLSPSSSIWFFLSLVGLAGVAVSLYFRGIYLAQQIQQSPGGLIPIAIALGKDPIIVAIFLLGGAFFLSLNLRIFKAIIYGIIQFVLDLDINGINVREALIAQSLNLKTNQYVASMFSDCVGEVQKNLAQCYGSPDKIKQLSSLNNYLSDGAIDKLGSGNLLFSYLDNVQQVVAPANQTPVLDSSVLVVNPTIQSWTTILWGVHSEFVQGIIAILIAMSLLAPLWVSQAVNPYTKQLFLSWLFRYILMFVALIEYVFLIAVQAVAEQMMSQEGIATGTPVNDLNDAIYAGIISPIIVILSLLLLGGNQNSFSGAGGFSRGRKGR